MVSSLLAGILALLIEEVSMPDLLTRKKHPPCSAFRSATASSFA
jgi:hypothetical protein